MTQTFYETPQREQRVPAPFDEEAWELLLADAASQVRERENAHRLPRELLARLLDLGLGRARVPISHGGLGWSLRTTFERLVELARADSHLAHVFRGHLVLLEEVALFAEPAVRDLWFARAVAGDFIGNAQSERTETLEVTTTLRRDGERLLLDGTKYYTTGSIYADWIDLVATTEDGEIVLVTVSTAQPGVVCEDDWDGFGQQLTGTGTTRFVGAEVRPGDVRGSERSTAQGQLRQGLFQLVLLAVVAGIGQASVDEAVTYVRGRRRLFGRFGETEVREDPIVQDTIGAASSGAFAARTLVTAVAGEWDRLLDRFTLGLATEADFREGKRDVFRIQGEVIDRVLTLTTEIFEVGGASQVSDRHGLDRFWRHARTVASHNPARQRRRLIGAHELGVEEGAEQFGDVAPPPPPRTP
jgi:alkylation response protein AidB-like acyl-CoA dehydrogenase